jgi:hypothetical protein
MRKVTAPYTPLAHSDPSQHGDQTPVQTPPEQLVAETLSNVRGAFDIRHPTPTPGYIPPGRGKPEGS